MGDPDGKLLLLTQSKLQVDACLVPALVHQPLHHLDVKAEALVDGVGLPPNAGLEFEHLSLVHDEAVLENTAAALLHLSFYLLIFIFFFTFNWFASVNATAFLDSVGGTNLLM